MLFVSTRSFCWVVLSWDAYFGQNEATIHAVGLTELCLFSQAQNTVVNALSQYVDIFTLTPHDQSVKFYVHVELTLLKTWWRIYEYDTVPPS